MAFPTSVAVGDPITATLLNWLIVNAAQMDSGTISITPSALNTPTSGAITFNKTFYSIPKVYVTVGTSTATFGSITAATTTGATGWVTQVAGSLTARTLQWFAVLTQ